MTRYNIINIKFASQKMYSKNHSNISNRQEGAAAVDNKLNKIKTVQFVSSH